MKLLGRVLLLLLVAAALFLQPIGAETGTQSDPTVDSKPDAPSEKLAPEEKPAPEKEETPAEEDTSEEKETPSEESTPGDTSAEKATPAEKDTPAEDTPAEEDTPADDADKQNADDTPSPPEDKAADDSDGQIKGAPVVSELPGGVGDLATDGPCAGDISMFCETIKPGGSSLAECIQNQIKDEEQGASEFTAQVTEACKAELLSYKMKLVSNINMDENRRKACKKDAQKICEAEFVDSEPLPGKVIECLTEARPALSKLCANSIYEAQVEAAQDYRLNAILYQQCRGDADKVCAHVEPGQGRVNACLRSKRSEITWECQAELFKIDVQDADDLRLSVKLFRSCLADKRKFCPDVAPGNGRAKACLEEHQNEPGFSSDCKDEIEKMMEARTKDYRLDPALRTDCQSTIASMCGFQVEQLTAVQSEESYVVECLQDFSDEIEDPSCKAAVARTISRGSNDFRFAVVVAKACKDDRDKFCKSIPPGDARVIRCLEGSRDHLTKDCKVAMFDHMTRMSEDIDFNKPLKDACSSEIKENCEKVNPGHSRVVRCLQDGKRRKYSDKCKEELQRLEKEMGQDFRLNYRLLEACTNEVDNICGKEVCDRKNDMSCGGRVLRCLVDKKNEIKSESCKQEVFYYIKMEVSNFGNDVILAEKCRDDVEKFCKSLDTGDGRVHTCLREHRDKISAGCAAEELKLEIEESNNFELRTNLKQACASERETFCAEMQTGQARVFRCLVHNLGKADFGEICKKQVIMKLSRRQQNWKLDVTLRRACKDDAADVCEHVDHDSDHAEVTRCLMRNHQNVTESCQTEVSRSAYMALYVWQDNAPLSAMCSSDVKSCRVKNPLVAEYPGKILNCLVAKAGRNATENDQSKLSEDCNTILAIAQPPDVKSTFDTYFQKVAAMSTTEKMTHVGVWDQKSGVTITGYTALACFSALCTTVVMTSMYVFKQWRGIKDPATGYVQVVKQGDV